MSRWTHNPRPILTDYDEATYRGPSENTKIVRDLVRDRRTGVMELLDQSNPGVNVDDRGGDFALGED